LGDHELADKVYQPVDAFEIDANRSLRRFRRFRLARFGGIGAAGMIFLTAGFGFRNGSLSHQVLEAVERMVQQFHAVVEGRSD
jgi:hypothetical protein